MDWHSDTQHLSRLDLAHMIGVGKRLGPGSQNSRTTWWPVVVAVVVEGCAVVVLGFALEFACAVEQRGTPDHRIDHMRRHTN